MRSAKTIEPLKIEELIQFIDHKVDFVASLSEDDSNSWCEEASVSASDPNNGADEYYDEEDCETPITVDFENRSGLGKKKALLDVENQITTDNDSNQSFSGTNPKHSLVINVSQTEYDVIKKVAKKVCNWKLKYYKEDHEGAIRNEEKGLKLSQIYDLTWHDLSIGPDFLSKLHPW